MGCAKIRSSVESMTDSGQAFKQVAPIGVSSHQVPGQTAHQLAMTASIVKSLAGVPMIRAQGMLRCPPIKHGIPWAESLGGDIHATGLVGHWRCLKLISTSRAKT